MEIENKETEIISQNQINNEKVNCEENPVDKE